MQQAIKAKCYHPSGCFVAFQQADLEQSIPERFEHIVHLHPDRLAVKTREHTLTYEALNKAANRVAHALLAQPGERGVPIAVLLEKDAPLMAAILGALKAGKMYVPLLDPSFPQASIASMLQDSLAQLVVTNNNNLAFVRELTQGAVQIVNIDTIDVALATENPGLAISADDLAYIMYTSGSTGKPKGVVHTHRNVLHDCMSYTNNLHICAADRVALLASCCFGASVHYLYGALLNGAALYPLDIRDEGFIHLAAWLRQEQITIYQSSANVFRYFLDTLTGAQVFADVRLIALGSAPVTRQDVERYKQYFPPTCILLNRLSTTETRTIRWHFVDHETPINGETVAVGYAVEDKEVLLIDEAGTAVGPEEIGEIVVRSRYLSPGYWRWPQLTEAAFRVDPQDVEQRLYRTGDLGRMQPDGCLEHLGRKDCQVKIRGFTVEVRAIEIACLAHPHIREAVIATAEDARGDTRLVAYLVPNQQPPPSSSALRRFLTEKLPDYMVPSEFVLRDALPLTPGGKVDRQALAALAPARPQLDTVFMAPRTAVEVKLAKIWAEVLGLGHVGVHDNFFALGGHSLSGTRVISRIRVTFQVELPLRCLFESPTVAALADDIQQARQIKHGRRPRIQLIARDGALPLSFAQKRLWFLNQLEPGIPVYNQPRSLRFRGVLNLEALQKTLDAIVARHEVLRSSFAVVDGSPVQVVGETRSVALPVLDLSAWPVHQRDTECQRLLAALSRQPFDLSQDLLLRATLLRLGAQDHVLLLVTHDIASDGWSGGILFHELSALYHTLAIGATPALPALPVQYADFAAWQSEWLQEGGLDTQLTYWKEHLQGVPPLLQLPTDRPRPAIQTYQGARQAMVLPIALTQGLKRLSQQHRVTLFMTLLAAFQTLLYRYTGQADIVVGSPIAQRTSVELEGLIGCFVNTLVLRANCAGNPPFVELLARLREVCLGAYAHQDLPFEKLVEAVQPEWNLDHNPLLQVMFQLSNIPRAGLELQGLKVEEMECESGIAKFDITLSMIDEGEQLTGVLEYSTVLFDAATMDRLLGHFQTLLTGIVAHPYERIERLPLLTAAEQRQRLLTWNDTKRSVPRDLCLHQLFEAQAARTPDSVAVVYDNQQLTYRTLNARANQLAHYLHKLGVGPEGLVGLCMERSLEMVVGILGVLKAGGAYVPLDPAYPQERLACILADAQLSVVLTQQPLVQLLPACDARLVCLDAVADNLALESEEPVSASVHPGHLAYLLYTSGLTGQPKGVAIEHRSAVALVWWAQTVFTAEEMAGVLASTSVCFDLSVFELFAPLTCGGKVIVVESALALPTLPMASAVTLINTVPSAMVELLRLNGIPPSMQTVNLAGEPLRPSLVQQIYAMTSAKKVYDLYGLSEATTYSTCALRTPEGPQTIGRPIANTQLYVLDRQKNAVPIGVTGELYLGGAGLARGYWRRPELTAATFLPNPFSVEPGARLYRTGDLARYLPDGNIELLGRMDQQVKLRGFRIELGEIEMILAGHPTLHEQVVVHQEDHGGTASLVAYVVPKQGQEPTPSELRSFLQAQLPAYMVPSAFVFLEALPLTPNGKVDRRVLPSPAQSRPGLQSPCMAPRTPVEEALVRIWATVLKLEQIGVNDNFFELGGHSLLATQAVSRVRQVFQIDLALRVLFEKPSIAQLAQVITAMLSEKTATEELECILAELVYSLAGCQVKPPA